MCPDKSNVYPLDCKLDNNYKTMVVASDIKHIMLVADIIHAVEISLYIGKVSQRAAFTTFTHSCKAVLASGCLAIYFFRGSSVIILIEVIQGALIKG